MVRFPAITSVSGAKRQTPVRLPLVEPMLAVAGEVPRDQNAFAFEVKWDGVRAIGYWDGRNLKLLSRNQIDITSRYPELTGLGQTLGRKPAILDGEIVALDETGRPSFGRLQHRMHVQNPGARGVVKAYPALYVPFDILYSAGGSLQEKSYADRRAELLARVTDGPSWRISPSSVGDGDSLLAAARENGLEGIVAKRTGSVYQPGRRSGDWIKIKVVHGQEFVIGGWIPEAGTNEHRVGSLLVGYFSCANGQENAESAFHFAGGIGTGFNEATHAMLTKRLRSLAAEENPFAERLPRREIRFVRPKLVAEIEFRRWPSDGLLHQASFKGLRLDKDPRQVVREDLPNCQT